MPLARADASSLPSSSIALHNGITDSGAPLQYNHRSFPCSMTTDMRRLAIEQLIDKRHPFTSRLPGRKLDERDFHRIAQPADHTGMQATLEAVARRGITQQPRRTGRFGQLLWISSWSFR